MKAAHGHRIDGREMAAGLPQEQEETEARLAPLEAGRAGSPTPSERVDLLRERLIQGPMKPGELARLARGWGVDAAQLGREAARARKQLTESAPQAVAYARSMQLLEQAAADAAQVQDPGKRAALRIKIASETARLHGLGGGARTLVMAPDPEPSRARSLAEELRGGG